MSLTSSRHAALLSLRWERRLQRVFSLCGQTIACSSSRCAPPTVLWRQSPVILPEALAQLQCRLRGRPKKGTESYVRAFGTTCRIGSMSWALRRCQPKSASNSAPYTVPSPDLSPYTLYGHFMGNHLQSSRSAAGVFGGGPAYGQDL